MQQHGHIIVSANIEDVWQILDLSSENLAKIDPQIIGKSQTINKVNIVGSTFTHDFKVGDRVYNQETKIINYANKEEKKMIGISYMHLNQYEFRRIHILEKLGENSTKITCVIERIPKTWYKHYLFVMPGKKKPLNVEKHLLHLKSIIEEDE